MIKPALLHFSRFFFNKLRQLLVIVVFIALILITMTSIITMEIKSTLQQSVTYQNLFLTGSSAWPKEFLGLLTITYAFYNQHEIWPGEAFPSPSWSTLTDFVVTDDWVSQTFDNFWVSFVEWLKQADQLFPQFAIDFNPVKNNIKIHSAETIGLTIIQNINICPQYKDENYRKPDGFLTCVPQSQDLTTIAIDTSNAIANSLPEKVTIEELYQQGFLVSAWYNPVLLFKQYLEKWDYAQRFGFVLGLLFFSLYITLSTTRFDRLAIVIARPLFWLGVMFILSAAALNAAIKPIIEYFDFQDWRQALYFVSNLGLSSIIKYLATRLIAWGGITILAGFAIRMIDVFVKKIISSFVRKDEIKNIRTYRRIKPTYR